MYENKNWLKGQTIFFLISLLTLVTFFTLFSLCSLDDNKLTSWQWAFIGVGINKILIILVFGIIIAYFFSKFSFPERTPALFLFCLSFIVCAIFWKEPEVIVDVSRYFTQAKHLEVYGIKYFTQEWGKSIHAWTDMPLVPFLYGLIFKFLGESRIYIQIFTTLLFSMTIVLTYLTGKMLWDKETGFLAGASLLGMPYLFTQVPLMLIDVPTMFFLTFSVFAFIKAMEKGGAWITISSIAVFLAFYSKYSTWLMLSVLIVILIVYLKIPPTPTLPLKGGGQGRGWRQTIFYRGGVIALIALIFIGIVISFKFDVISGQIKLLQEYQRPGLKRWGEGFVSSFLYQVHPFITIAALYSIYAAFRKRDWKYLIISYLVFIVTLLQIRRIRYIMVTFPMLALMASYGLQKIKDKGVRRFIVACAVVSSLVVAIFAYLPFLERMSAVNLKNAGMFLNSLDVENVEVFTISSAHDDVNQAVSAPILDYFTEKNISYHYDKSSLPSPEKFKESPLRFTWEYRNPVYYTVNNFDSEKAGAVVVISGAPELPFTANIDERTKKYHNFKIFKVSEDIFQYRTIVKVYYD